MVATAALLANAAVVVADATISCSPDSPCPQSAPCCNAQGICGSTPDYCQGGCDTRSSFALDSCAPMPVCRSGTYTFDNQTVSDMAYYQFYDGDSTKNPWTYTGEVLSENGNAILTMRKNSVGTVMFSTFYVFYGKVTVTMKTSHLAGVVSDFILMSNVKDEIDYEFVGTQLETAQTNYYYEGILNWTNEKNGAVDSSTYDNFHTYTIDWNPNSLTWEVDGTPVRTLNKADTLNQTTNLYEYPQTPARLQLAIWPGGASNQGEGTIEWAGGAINWNAPDLTDPGYYFVEVEKVEVECYDPPSDVKVSGSKSYVYTSKAVQESDVEITNDDTETPVSGSAASDTATSTGALLVVSHVHETTSSPAAQKTKSAAGSASSLAAVSEVASSSDSSASASMAAASTGAASSAGSTQTASVSSAGAAGSMAAPLTGFLALLAGLLL